ncbi:efflux RND transporter periplasmic adaptor subunit [Ferrimonas senticii]|uniref:efflux RND transporter periplasmic adaptor subunit n=1 Tax=Ferrimonas senticii TaxID=394566 RepID=UPI000427FFE5|nr:efflux RND transporter periplasmic adaptor subunit [Ferrimonas senticii]
MKRSLLLSAVTLATLLSGCTAEQVAAPEQAKPRPVKLLTVAASGQQLAQSYPATVSAAESAALTFQIGGIIDELLVKEGQQVQQGQVIARLNSEDLDSALISAEAQYRNAQSNFDRGQKLAVSGTISASQMDELSSNRNVTLANYQKAQKAVKDAVLVAPFSGVIANLPVERLDNINAGELVASVLATDLMKVTINVPAATIAGAKNDRQWRSYLVLSSLPQVQFPAQFNSAQLEADPISQTYAVHFYIQVGEQHLVLPGMNGKLFVERTVADVAPNRFTLPLTAILSDGQNQYVWVFDASSQTLSKRVVTLAADSAEMATVISGLQAGEQVVAAGGSFLAEGLAVRPWQR